MSILLLLLQLLLPIEGGERAGAAGGSGAAGGGRAGTGGSLPPVASRGVAGLDSALANDNRVSAGRVTGGVLEIRLEARLAKWRPDPAVDSLVTVQAFAEAGAPARIPGPLLRVAEGTVVRVSIRNAVPDSQLIVHGLRAGTVSGPDTVHVPAGGTREVRYTAGRAGTYLYWGSNGPVEIAGRAGRDAQLNGAIVVDARGGVPDARERIFVLSLIDILPDSTKPPPRDDVWEVAINGRSWPHTERLRHEVGDTVRWRFLNATDRVHPMHLHGFHFRALAKGSGEADTTYAPPATRLAVTELMLPGSTFRLEWVPTRPGNWLMHCHMVPHITPYPERPDSLRGHDVHQLAEHPLAAMAGLVLGITVTDPHRQAAAAPPASATRRLRVLAQERVQATGGPPRRAFVLQDGPQPARDSVVQLSSPLLLVRGETTAITVVNHLAEPTTVHWHGMELESVYDGVSGWSGAGRSLAPLLSPGDSFVVQLTPPRSGTFIYHTHMDEGMQLVTGLYGPLLVLEPGERYEPESDLLFMIGRTAGDQETVAAINGRKQPEPLRLQVGREYRVRLINMLPAAPVWIELLADSVPIRWTAVAKDGATLPAALQREVAAKVRLGVGETYDFQWRPESEAELLLDVRGGPRDPLRVEQNIRVRR